MELTKEQKTETITAFTLTELRDQVALLEWREARKAELIDAFSLVEQPARAKMNETKDPALERFKAIVEGPVKSVQDRELAMKEELLAIVNPARDAYDAEIAPAEAEYNGMIRPIQQKLFDDCGVIDRGERDAERAPVTTP